MRRFSVTDSVHDHAVSHLQLDLRPTGLDGGDFDFIPTTIRWPRCVRAQALIPPIRSPVSAALPGEISEAPKRVMIVKRDMLLQLRNG
jgi:hypothetical protein